MIGSSSKKVYKNKKELFEKANSALHIPFKYIDETNRLRSPKGGIGQMVEESVFEYHANSFSEPDIPNLGIEIKTSPYIKNKNEYSSKERLVLGIIDYMNENLNSFYESDFWHKNGDLLILFYEYLKDGTPKEEWTFSHCINFQWPDVDLEIVKNDWKIITDKIKSGKAHELSEKDTTYLAACTKGATANKSYREQPFSELEAKQRAYSLKVSYMTYILRNYVLGTKSDEKIIKSIDQIKGKTFEEAIKEIVNPYIGKTQEELIKTLNIKESKQTNASIIRAIFKIDGNISETQEFKKAAITPKTINIDANGNIKESMSFRTFDFIDLIGQEWEESDFYNDLQSRFMFIIFKNNKRSIVFEGIKFCSLNYYELQEAKAVWERTRDLVLNNGIILTKTSKGISNNLPKIKDNYVSHVRPKATQSYYKFDDYEKGNVINGSELLDGRWMTKQCFWLNASFIKKKLNELQD